MVAILVEVDDSRVRRGHQSFAELLLLPSPICGPPVAVHRVSLGVEGRTGTRNAPREEPIMTPTTWGSEA